MAKPEWGTKRICLNCGARFYDLNHDPITCPSCSTVLDPVAQSRPRRSRAAPKLAAVAAVVEPDEAVVVEPDEEVEADLEDDEEEVVVVAAVKDDEEDEEQEDDAEDDGESAIEDVSELGDDDIDVIETDLDEDEQER